MRTEGKRVDVGGNLIQVKILGEFSMKKVINNIAVQKADFFFSRFKMQILLSYKTQNLAIQEVDSFWVQETKLCHLRHRFF